MIGGKRYIYVLTHVKTGKKYVGVTFNPKERERRHRCALKGNYHECKDLQADYHDDPRLTFEVIAETEGNLEGFHLERDYILRLKTYDERIGYNNRDVRMRYARRRAGLPESNSFQRRDWVTA